MTEVVVHFGDTPSRLPTSLEPPSPSPSLVPPVSESELPISLGKGEGQLGLHPCL